eukprot:1481616-Prymnesium_polylepis.1
MSRTSWDCVGMGNVFTLWRLAMSETIDWSWRCCWKTASCWRRSSASVTKSPVVDHSSHSRKKRIANGVLRKMARPAYICAESSISVVAFIASASSRFVHPRSSLCRVTHEQIIVEVDENLSPGQFLESAKYCERLPLPVSRAATRLRHAVLCSPSRRNICKGLDQASIEAWHALGTLALHLGHISPLAMASERDDVPSSALCADSLVNTFALIGRLPVVNRRATSHQSGDATCAGEICQFRAKVAERATATRKAAVRRQQRHRVLRRSAKPRRHGGLLR